MGQGLCSDVFIFFGRGSSEDLSEQGEKEIEEESQETVCANQAPSAGNPVRQREKLILRLPLLGKLAFINSPYDLNIHCQVLHHALC